jgi:hypothetical protein
VAAYHVGKAMGETEKQLINIAHTGNATYNVGIGTVSVNIKNDPKLTQNLQNGGFDGLALGNFTAKDDTRIGVTANGVTGIFGYLSTFVSGLGIGAMVDWVNKVNPGQGWNYVFLMMIAMAVVGMLIFMLMWRAKATGYDTDEQQA